MGAITASSDVNERQAAPALVHVVDDDAGMCAAVSRLLRAHGIRSCSYDSGASFLSEADLTGAGCILLDVRMPEMSGLDVQSRLRARGVAVPTIFLTGAAEVPIAVAAMRAGAVDFIEKPFESEYLLQRIRQAIASSLQALNADHGRRQARNLAARLTPREREVLTLVAKGLTNKEAARIIGSSHRTVEIQRRSLMEKLDAVSLADLVRLELLLVDVATAVPDT